MSQKNSKAGEKVAIGMGLAALAAAAAGAVYLYGTTDGAKKRKEVKGWMLKARGEILEKVEKLKDVSKDTYEQAVDTVAKRYEGVKTIDPNELKSLVRDVKSHWANIQKHLAGATKAKKPKAKKKASVKKTV